MKGNCVTVTGKTLAENVAGARDLDGKQQVIVSLDKPIKPSGHIQILRGNLAPEGSVAKITGKEGLSFSGVANVFDSEEDMVGIRTASFLPRRCLSFLLSLSFCRSLPWRKERSPRARLL